MSLTAATRAETTKQFTTSMWWILAIVLVGYVGFTASVLGLVLGGSASGSLPGEAPPLPEEGLSAALYSVATAVGYVFPLLIGTLVVTAEFRHKTLTPTFLATPRRGRVLIAKLTVGALLGIVFGMIGIVVSVGASAAFLVSFGLDTDLGSVDTWAMLGRMLLAYVLWALIGVGIGALVRNQVGAIVGVLVFTQFIEPIGRAVSGFVEGLADFTQYLPGAASDALVGASVFTMSIPEGAMTQLEWWQGGLVLLGYAVVFVVLGQLASWRRDVS
jgi:hypothetical protein